MKILLVACALITMSSATILAQEHQHGNHSKTVMKKDTSKVENIVREGIIDLKAIDKNKDDKVFQDMMDWNVISDKPGKCPICGMDLIKASTAPATIKTNENAPEGHGTIVLNQSQQEMIGIKTGMVVKNIKKYLWRDGVIERNIL